MWKNDTGTNEYIYDCDSLQLAVKVGLFGVIITIARNFIYHFLMMIYTVTSIADRVPFYLLENNLSTIGFVGAIFVSVGFVAIFSMKGSKLGIIFPLMIIIPHVGQFLYLRISYELDIYSLELHTTSMMILGYAITILGGLLILSIRRKSENTQFVSIFAIFYILQSVVSDAIWSIIFRGPVQVNISLDYFITSLPYLATFVIVSFLTTIFFALESKQGCIEKNEFQETPFPE